MDIVMLLAIGLVLTEIFLCIKKKQFSKFLILANIILILGFGIERKLSLSSKAGYSAPDYIMILARVYPLVFSLIILLLILLLRKLKRNKI